MKQTATAIGALTDSQRHQLGSATDCARDASSHLAALVASNPPLFYRLVALSAIVLIARCERRLTAAFNAPTDEAA